MSLADMAHSGDPGLRAVARRYGYPLPGETPRHRSPHDRRRSARSIEAGDLAPLPDPTVASLAAWQIALARLWSAVLEQACEDLIGRDQQLARAAFEWLFATATGPQSCDWVCRAIGLKPAVWRRGVELRLEAHIRGESFWLSPPPRHVESVWDAPPGIEEGRCRR